MGFEGGERFDSWMGESRLGGAFLMRGPSCFGELLCFAGRRRNSINETKCLAFENIRHSSSSRRYREISPNKIMCDT